MFIKKEETMATYSPHKYKSKNDKVVIIRSAIKTDAEGILKLAKSVIKEEIYQLTSASEFNIDMQNEEKWIDDHFVHLNHIILVAEIDSQIVGMLNFSNGEKKRTEHTGELGISISHDFRNQGIGALLLTSLIEWATTNKTIEKICLCVHGNNDRAIALYQKMGFEIEGRRKRDVKYGEDHYVDTIMMGRFL